MMHKNSENEKGNTSRLSLALVDLPLTPFGMKSPFSNSKTKFLSKNGDNCTKHSLLKLKSLKKIHCLPTVEEKENINFPINLTYVNTRRRERNKRQGKTDGDNNNFQYEEGTMISQTRRNFQINTKRDSLFTDIDDGSFVEFTGKPSSEQGLPLFYYTCTDNNETKYSTSSKMPLSPVGFRKYVDAVKNKYSLHNIVEETLHQTEKSRKPTFALDESVIAGSRDMMNFKNCHRSLNNILNSTENPQKNKIVHELPDISSLKLDNVSPKQKFNNHFSKKERSIECIVISESEDELQYNTNKKNGEHNKEKSKLDKSKKCQSKNNCLQNKSDCESSIISEDVSLSPSGPERPARKKSPLKTPSTPLLSKFNILPKHELHKKYETSNGEQIVASVQQELIPEVNDRVVGWVLNSPFKDASFGTSFEVNENSPCNLIRSNPNAIAVSSQSLDLRLSDDSLDKGSGKTVFTLGRVAESPDIEDVAPCGRVAESPDIEDVAPCKRNSLISSDNEFSSDEHVPSKIEILSTEKMLQKYKNQIKCAKAGRNLFSSSILPMNELENAQPMVIPLDFNDSTGALTDSLNLINKSKQDGKSYYVTKETEISNSHKINPLLTSRPNSIKNFNNLLSEDNYNNDNFNNLSQESTKSGNEEKKSLDFSGINSFTEDEYPSAGEMVNISPCKRKSKGRLNLSRSRSESELNLSNDALVRRNSLKNRHDNVSVRKKSILPISNGRKSVDDTVRKNVQVAKSSVCLDTSNESLPDIDLKNRYDERPNSLKLIPHKSIAVSDSDIELPMSGTCHVSDNKYSPSQLIFDEKKLKNNKFHTPTKVYVSNSDSSEDNFENYINSLKKDNNNKKKYEDHCDDNFIISDSDDIEYYSSSPVLSIYKNLRKKNVKETKKINNQRKNTQRIVIGSSSSDSEEEPSVPKRNPKLKTTKSKSVIKEQDSVKKALKDRKQLSFLSSLTQDTSISEAHIDAVPFLKAFKKNRDILTTKLYSLYNTKVFENQLPSSMDVKWNSRMTKTAGYCYYQIDKSKSSGRGARIELSVKVIDAPGRLRDTLIHEMCHAAAWVISGYKDGHGPIWKSWASKVKRVFPELPVIKRCHSYKINCKYTYKCVNCGYSIERHSKSLDTEKKVCGYCYGKFELIVNYAKKKQGSEAQTKESNTLLKAAVCTPRTPSAFALYVKDNYGVIKKSQTGMKHKDVMKALSEQFARMKTNI